MKIQIKYKSNIYFLQSFPRNERPNITPSRALAWEFTNLTTCKGIRDAVLEYFPKNAVIVA